MCIKYTVNKLCRYYATGYWFDGYNLKLVQLFPGKRHWYERLELYWENLILSFTLFCLISAYSSRKRDNFVNSTCIPLFFKKYILFQAQINEVEKYVAMAMASFLKMSSILLLSNKLVWILFWKWRNV